MTWLPVDPLSSHLSLAYAAACGLPASGGRTAILEAISAHWHWTAIVEAHRGELAGIEAGRELWLATPEEFRNLLCGDAASVGDRGFLGEPLKTAVAPWVGSATPGQTMGRGGSHAVPVADDLPSQGQVLGSTVCRPAVSNLVPSGSKPDDES